MTRTETAIVTASGSVVGQGVMKCLKFANEGGRMRYRIVATDASPLAAGLYRGDVGIIVPEASDPGYVDAVARVCREQGAGAVFPGSDEELLYLSRGQKRIREEGGAVVMVNPARVLQTSMDKWTTYLFLTEAGMPTPKSAVPEGDPAFYELVGFPMVVKPRGGHGSYDVRLARDRAEAELAIRLIEKSGGKPMLQEYLADDGNEFTTGVTVAEDGRSVMSSIAMRRTLKAGQTYKAFIDSFDDVRASAEEVALKLGARGPMNVQARVSDGVVKAFEVNPRLSASCPMRAVAGVNEPDILYRSFVLGERVRVRSYQRLVSMRYWNELYLRPSTVEKTRKEKSFSGPDSAVLPYF